MTPRRWLYVFLALCLVYLAALLLPAFFQTATGLRVAEALWIAGVGR
jgi:hypothetical protein